MWTAGEGSGHICTNALDLQLDMRAHDLVPAVDAPDQPAAAFEAACAAERVREGGRGREVGFYRLALHGGRRLRKEVDYGGDFGGWVFHCVWLGFV